MTSYPIPWLCDWRGAPRVGDVVDEVTSGSRHGCPADRICKVSRQFVMDLYSELRCGQLSSLFPLPCAAACHAAARLLSPPSMLDILLLPERSTADHK